MIEAGKKRELWFSDIHQNQYGISLRIKETLLRKHSPFQLVEVMETEGFGRLLALDGTIMLTERDEFVYHEMLAHVPLCAHPEPREVLIIGGGDGGTLREALKHPSIRRLDLVEIDEEVIEASRRFLPTLNTGFDDPRTSILFQDGIEFVKGRRDEYDVVVVDSTDPLGPAVGLFEAPFYRNVFQVLRPGGILALQSESPFFDGPLLASINSTLRTLFPHVSPYLAPIVTYPGGHWGFAFAGKAQNALDAPYSDSYRERGLQTRYYTPEIHHAAFQLPRYLQDLLK
ncbi:MAG: polyamine aminopropyltransferase [Nitrospinota bacterium]